MKRMAVFLLILLSVVVASCSAPATPQVFPTPAVLTPTVLPPTDTAAPPPEPATATAEPPTAIPPSPTPAATQPPPRVAMLKIPAPSLANNLLGEPAEQQIFVYLPPSYNSSETRYPTVYFLPGYQESFIGVSLPDDLDKLISAGTIKEMILVIASGQNSLGGSFYVNSPVTGNWEDYIVKDLVQYIDSKYRTQAEAGRRGIAGFSMGGFGALNLAMKYPDVFGAVFCMSPGLFDEQGLAESQMFSSDQLPEQFLAAAQKMESLGTKEMVSAMRSNSQLFSFAYGAAFSPDPSGKPPYIQYPYRLNGGQLERDEAVWKAWENGYGGFHDKIAQYKENFLKLKGIGLNYGTKDSYAWIPKGCLYFVNEMKAAGIPLTVTTFEGGHSGDMSGRIRTEMLPFLSHLIAE